MSRVGWQLLRLVAFGLAFVSWSREGPGTHARPPFLSWSYRPAFQEDFNTLDLSRDGSGAHTWYEGVWFNRQHAPLANISVSDSALLLKWRSEQASPDTSIATFSLDGRKRHAWRYGYFEARMKWDVVPGAWPAFWLIPVEDAERRAAYNGVRESGEIDVFEGQGDRPHTFYGTVHDWVDLRSTANVDNHFALPENIDLSQFHVYGMLWTPGRISWYLDNRFLHAEPTPAIADKQKFFIVLSMQEGVNWKLGDTSGVQRSEMLLSVDWVRVWQSRVD